MAAVRASAGGFDASNSGWLCRPRFWFWEQFSIRGLIREVSNAGDLQINRPMGENSDDPEKLARTDPT
jgi:hypothetical protein